MAREIKKPAAVKENQLKEFAGPVVIEVTPKTESSAPVMSKSEQRRRAVAEAVAEAAAVTASQQAKTISFGAWFQKVSRSKGLKLSYKEAIEAHCRSIGIAAQATEEEYDAALKHFGL